MMGRLFHVVLAVGLSAVYWSHLVGAALFALDHLLFPALLLVVYGILFGMVGASYGLPGLFWHDRLRTRLGAATAVTLLLALTGVLAFYAAGPLDNAGTGPEAKAAASLTDRKIPGVGGLVADSDPEAGSL